MWCNPPFKDSAEFIRNMEVRCAEALLLLPDHGKSDATLNQL